MSREHKCPPGIGTYVSKPDNNSTCKPLTCLHLLRGRWQHQKARKAKSGARATLRRPIHFPQPDCRSDRTCFAVGKRARPDQREFGPESRPINQRNRQNFLGYALHSIDTPCYKMNVPETQPRDPNLYCKSDLGAWQVAFQSPKCIYTKYFKYLSITFPSSSGHHFFSCGCRHRDTDPGTPFDAANARHLKEMASGLGWLLIERKRSDQR